MGEVIDNGLEAEVTKNTAEVNTRIKSETITESSCENLAADSKMKKDDETSSEIDISNTQPTSTGDNALHDEKPDSHTLAKDKSSTITNSIVEGSNSKSDSVSSTQSKNPKSTAMKWLGLTLKNDDNLQKQKHVILNDTEISNEGDDDRTALGKSTSSQSQILNRNRSSSSTSTMTNKRKDATPNPFVTPAEGSIPKKKKMASSSSDIPAPGKRESATSKSSLVAHRSLPQNPSLPTSGSNRNVSPKSSSSKGSTPKSIGSEYVKESTESNVQSGVQGSSNKTQSSSSSGSNNSNSRSTLDGQRRGQKSSPTSSNWSTRNIGVASGRSTTPTSKNMDVNALHMTPTDATSTAKSTSRSLTLRDKQNLRNLKEACDLCIADHKFLTMNYRVNGSGSSNYSIDLYGSFLTKDLDEHKYDFFDHDSDGNIILKPRPPMFPEEFPPGVKDLPLSWWGVKDVVIGTGKYGSGRTTTAPTTATSPKKTTDESVSAAKRGNTKSRVERKEESSAPAQRRNHDGTPPSVRGNGYEGPHRPHPGGGWVPPPGYTHRRGDGPPPPYYWNGPHDGPIPPYWNGPPPPHHDGPYPPHPPHPPHWSDYPGGGFDGPPHMWNGPPGGSAPHSRHWEGPGPIHQGPGGGGRHGPSRPQGSRSDVGGGNRAAPSSRRR